MRCKDCGRDIFPGEAFAVIRGTSDEDVRFQCLDCADKECLEYMENGGDEK